MLDFSKEKIEEKVKSIEKTEGTIYCICGPSGTGKTAYTIKFLRNEGKVDIILDGDSVRYYVNDDLGYTAEDRKINNLRIAKIALLLTKQGFNIAISTVRADIAYEFLKSKISNIFLIKP